jgi:NAD(P)-dependent dehydrogenase (short-subunit alcohol dehydrogenase family)
MGLERFRLDGRIAVVTGAGRGPGFAIAEALIQAGAKVKIAEVRADLGCEAERRLGPNARFVPLDVTDSAPVAAAARDLMVEEGKIDILVNNAGFNIVSDALDTTDEIWRRQIAGNLDGVFFCSREFARYMVERRSGSIVNMSSIAGLVVVKPQNHIGYNTAKAGVIQVSRTLSAGWASKGVRVNTICPDMSPRRCSRQWATISKGGPPESLWGE